MFDGATTIGAVAWFAGVCVWVGALGWTVRDNPTGAETGTGEYQAERRSIDHAGNAAVLVVALYLLAGSYELLAGTIGLPTLLDGATTRVSHMLGAGGATLLVFAVGFRLFSRFLVPHPPRALVALVLPTGIVGPALVAAGLYDQRLLAVGAVLEGLAVAGFALAYGVLYARSGRDRVGLTAVGVAVVGRLVAVIELHYRFALAGFLGLTVVGAAIQLYPPTVGEWPGSADRTALVAVALIAGGLVVQLLGLVVATAATVGELAVLGGTILYAYLLASAFVARG